MRRRFRQETWLVLYCIRQKFGVCPWAGNILEDRILERCDSVLELLRVLRARNCWIGQIFRERVLRSFDRGEICGKRRIVYDFSIEPRSVGWIGLETLYIGELPVRLG